MTISRGSIIGGQRLAERVAERLGSCCISREVLVELEYQATPDSTKALEDLPLSCRVQATGMAPRPSRGIEVESQANDGVIHVRGSVDAAELQEEILELARTMPGVKEGNPELDIRPIFPHHAVSPIVCSTRGVRLCQHCGRAE
jgi:hypothetical protein